MKNFKQNFKSIVQSMAREMDERVRRLKGASIQHPISIHSASIEHPLQSGGNQVAGKYLARIWKYAAMLLMVLTLGVGQTWATYYYCGEKSTSSWSSFHAMTLSTDGLYWYKSFSGAHQFKITDADNWDNGNWGEANVSAGFNGTGTNIGDYSHNGNAYTWESGSHYIIVYIPNTVINQTSSPKICASTSLPSNTNANTTLYIKHRWGSTDDKDWAWETMSASGSNTYEYTYKGEWGEAGCNIHTAKSDANFINKSDITNNASFSAGNEVIFTYNIKTNALTITESKYTVTLTNATASSVLAGYKTKPTITAQDKTGYNFSNWSVTGGATVTSSTSSSTTVAASAAGTATANYTAKSYSLTLKGNGGDDGAVTTTYNSSSTTSFSRATRSSYSCDGYYTQKTDGTLVLNADGTIPNSTVSNYLSSGKWVGDTVTMLWAHWTYDPTLYDVTFDVGTSYTSLGSLSATAGGDDISSGDDIAAGTSVTFTATPETGYEVEGWYTDEDCTEGKHDAGNNTYSIASLSSDVTVYVKFVEKTWSVAFAAGTGGSVTTPAATPQTVGQLTGISIAATPSSGYTFNTWTITSGSGSFTSSASTNSNKFKPTANSTITASFNETMRDITIVGGHVYNSASTSTTAGVATAAKITANDPATGKKFTGWTLGTGVSLKAGYSLTNQTIEIYSTANATVTANYADRASVKMYFAKPTTMGWSKVYAYAWKSTDASVRNAAYPGVELDETEVVNNIVYYVYQYYTEADGIGGTATGNSAWNRVVFGDNNDARKTADLTIADGHYYYMKSSTTGSGSAIANAWFIKGTMNSWGEDNPIAHDRSTNSGTVTINLEKDIQYEFKVYDQVSDTMWSNSAALGGITNSVDATTLYNNDLYVMKITPNKTGAYVFTITNTNTTAPKIAVDYPSQYLVGSWDSWDEDDHMFDANGYVRVYLTTSKDPYQFQVKYNGRWYGAKGAGTITSTTKDWGFSVSDGSDYNVSITIGTDGYYVFGWNGKDKKISVIYPADTTKAQLAPSKYIYFDARNLTAAGWWIDEFSTRFWLKNYASGVDITHVDCDIVDTVENKVFYALVPTEGQVGQVHLNRMSTNFAENWNEANKVYAVDRDNTDQNCLKEETGKEGDFTGWTPQWTKYCPPMTSATLTAVNAADKTVVYAGSGTKADPYIVATSAYIYVSASSVSKLNDANMEAQYCWYKTNVAESAYYNSSNTHIYTASSSNNVTDSMTVDAKNYYSSTYGRVSPRSNAIYYTARTPYRVDVADDTHVTQTSGATGEKAAVNNVAYVATFTADEGYNLPTSTGVVVLRSSSDITSNCSWSVTDGVGTLTVPASYVTAALSISVNGVLKTYDITYSGGTYGSGTLDGGTKTHGEDYDLSDNSTAFTRAGYAYDGWSTNAAGSSKDYNLGGTYTTNAAQTFYPHWVTAYSVTHTLNHINCTSGASGSIAGVSGYNYVATFTADAGYALPSTIGVTVGGAAKTQGTHFTWSVSDRVGTLTITSTYVTGTIVISITGTPVTLTHTAGSWQYASSWEPACVPTIEHDVIIPNLCFLQVANAQAKSVTIHNYEGTPGKLYLYATAFSHGGLVVAEGIKAVHSEGGEPEPTTDRDLSIQTDYYGNAGLICGEASADTKAQYLFYSKSRKYSSKWYVNQYVGIPFAKMDPFDWYGVNVYEYNPEKDDWMTPSNDSLKSFTCYNIISKSTESSTTYYTDGILNLPGKDSITTLDCSWRESDTTSIAGKASGYQDYMFANSWTAPIEIAAMDEDDFVNLVQTIYIFNAGYVDPADSQKELGVLAGQWSPFPLEAVKAGEIPNAVIPATQAFLVTAKSSGAKLKLDYEKIVYQAAIDSGKVNNYPTRAPRRLTNVTNPRKLVIKLYKDDVLADDLYIFQHANFKTDSLDNGWDGYKVAGEDYASEIYTIRGDANMAVDAVKDMNNTNVAFKASSQDSEYTLSFEYEPDGTPLYFYDKTTLISTEIENGATYTFTADDTKAHNRFLLTRSNSPQIATGVEEINTEKVKRAEKFMQDQQIFIRRGDRVYNVTGFLVK